MTDYVKALNDGFAAAQRAEVAKQEIDAIFAEMKEAVLKATGGKVQIERMQYEVAETGWGLTFVFPPKPKEKYWAIAALNPTDGTGHVIQLALWESDRAGYPCLIKWNKQEHKCEDRESLSACLSELLADPIVGQQLYSISKSEPTAKT